MIMSCDPNKEAILEALAEEAHEMYTNDGVYGEQAWILAREEAMYRYTNGLFDQGDYEDD
jgi:hypothetical protein